jgi:hypothetical protein
VPDASGQSAVLRATGDLDCDDVSGVYELRVTVMGTSLLRAWHRQNPYE